MSAEESLDVYKRQILNTVYLHKNFSEKTEVNLLKQLKCRPTDRGELSLISVDETGIYETESAFTDMYTLKHRRHFLAKISQI